jgi:hypothetical protein
LAQRYVLVESSVAVQDVVLQVQEPVLCCQCTDLMKVDTVVDAGTGFDAVPLAL